MTDYLSKYKQKIESLATKDKVIGTLFQDLFTEIDIPKECLTEYYYNAFMSNPIYITRTYLKYISKNKDISLKTILDEVIKHREYIKYNASINNFKNFDDLLRFNKNNLSKTPSLNITTIFKDDTIDIFYANDFLAHRYIAEKTSWCTKNQDTYNKYINSSYINSPYNLLFISIYNNLYLLSNEGECRNTDNRCLSKTTECHNIEYIINDYKDNKKVYSLLKYLLTEICDINFEKYNEDEIEILYNKYNILVPSFSKIELRNIEFFKYYTIKYILNGKPILSSFEDYFIESFKDKNNFESLCNLFRVIINTINKNDKILSEHKIHNQYYVFNDLLKTFLKEVIENKYILDGLTYTTIKLYFTDLLKSNIAFKDIADILLLFFTFNYRVGNKKGREERMALIIANILENDNRDKIHILKTIKNLKTKYIEEKEFLYNCLLETIIITEDLSIISDINNKINNIQQNDSDFTKYIIRNNISAENLFHEVAIKYNKDRQDNNSIYQTTFQDEIKRNNKISLLDNIILMEVDREPTPEELGEFMQNMARHLNNTTNNTYMNLLGKK